MRLHCHQVCVNRRNSAVQG